MKNHECPHLIECKQFILEHDFEWKCLGKISWNQENCFKSNAIGTKELRELPTMWWANKLIDIHRKMQTKKEESTVAPFPERVAPPPWAFRGPTTPEQVLRDAIRVYGDTPEVREVYRKWRRSVGLPEE